MRPATLLHRPPVHLHLIYRHSGTWRMHYVSNSQALVGLDPIPDPKVMEVVHHTSSVRAGRDVDRKLSSRRAQRYNNRVRPCRIAASAVRFRCIYANLASDDHITLRATPVLPLTSPSYPPYPCDPNDVLYDPNRLRYASASRQILSAADEALHLLRATDRHAHHAILCAASESTYGRKDGSSGRFPVAWQPSDALVPCQQSCTAEAPASHEGLVIPVASELSKHASSPRHALRRAGRMGRRICGCQKPNCMTSDGYTLHSRAIPNDAMQPHGN